MAWSIESMILSPVSQSAAAVGVCRSAARLSHPPLIALVSCQHLCALLTVRYLTGGRKRKRLGAASVGRTFRYLTVSSELLFRFPIYEVNIFRGGVQGIGDTEHEDIQQGVGRIL